MQSQSSLHWWQLASSPGLFCDCLSVHYVNVSGNFGLHWGQSQGGNMQWNSSWQHIMSQTVNNGGFFSLLSVQNEAVKPEICSADVVPPYPIFRPIEEENVEKVGASYNMKNHFIVASQKPTRDIKKTFLTIAINMARCKNCQAVQGTGVHDNAISLRHNE